MYAKARITGSVVAVFLTAGLAAPLAHAAAPGVPPGGIIPPGGAGPGPGGFQSPGGIGNISSFDEAFILDDNFGPPVIFDFGDAPDDGALCGRFGGLAFFPTIKGSTNALENRDAPHHGAVSLSQAVVIGRVVSYELTAPQSSCDWVTTGCDSFGDDGALILCFDGDCNSGVTLGGASCGQSGFGAYFGPKPAPGAEGFWVFYSSRGVNSNVPTYVNVVADVNQNGVFDDLSNAWCLRDAEVDLLLPNTQIYRTNPFPLADIIYTLPSGQWAVDAFWTRFMVSEEKLADTFDDTWDGSGKQGGYGGGETEDWIAMSNENEYLCSLPSHAFESVINATISLNPGSSGCDGGAVVQASSTDQPIGILREFRTSNYRTNRAVPIELTQLVLTGSSPSLGGDFVIRERADTLSIGVIDDINAGGGVFADGKARIDVWLEIELLDSGIVLNTGAAPVRLDAGTITAMPPLSSVFSIPSNRPPVRLFDKISGQPAGWLCISSFQLTESVPTVCPGDANGDRKVDFGDISDILSRWGSGGPTGDATGDCKVDFIDISSVLTNWGNGCR